MASWRRRSGRVWGTSGWYLKDWVLSGGWMVFQDCVPMTRDLTMASMESDALAEMLPQHTEKVVAVFRKANR